MVWILLALTLCVVGYVTGEDCPPGYARHTGTIEKNKSIQWKKCPVKEEPALECGELYPYTPSLVRVPANSTVANAKSIVTNPGGPGGSGVNDTINGATWYQERSGGLYNIISFDPRGVGLTIPYGCPNTESDSGLNFELSLTYNNAKGLQDAYTYLTKQGLRCGESDYKVDGQLIGTAFVARDINAIFEALNEDGLIRYWGSSYGTLLGDTLAAMFPEKIDRMVLDGNINPADYYHGTYEETVHDTDACLLNFFEACAEAGQPFCALAKKGYSGQELQEMFYNWFDNVKNSTYTVEGPDGSAISYPQLLNQMLNALYDPSKWISTANDFASYVENKTFSMSLDHEKRDFDPMVAVELGIENLTPNLLWGVTCGDWDDIPGTLQDYQRWLEMYESLSRFGGDRMIEYLFRCSKWEVNAKEQYDGPFTNIKTRSPILYVNGHFDPVTPLISAQNASSGFVNSRVLQHTSTGHCSDRQLSKCLDEKVSAYWISGTLPDADEICHPDHSVAEDAFILPAASSRLKRGTNFDYPVAFYSPVASSTQPQAPSRVLTKRTSTESELILIPATCTAEPGTGSTSSGSGSHSGSEILSEADVQRGLSDLKDICNGYTGDKWFFQLLCAKFG
ncbi:hypothetical protein LTR84_007404 [Exophiala bonariae]|uniref:AB hydrolase-1 domain-containing protein n=1 Tax=Exophiala bonariae TaxID=1690606 RepID=A0AAV9N0W2_9EURO|nr:hypothetical protein LTR84_007404 [Exophiala bonariae]